MDAATIIALGEKELDISLSAFTAFRQAASDAGADDATLADLDAKYAARIQHEQDIIDGKA
jgi:hypothetical protein